MSLQEERRYKNKIWDDMVLQKGNSLLLPFAIVWQICLQLFRIAEIQNLGKVQYVEVK